MRVPTRAGAKDSPLTAGVGWWLGLIGQSQPCWKHFQKRSSHQPVEVVGVAEARAE
jgi:hypothetical protein